MHTPGSNPLFTSAGLSKNNENLASSSDSNPLFIQNTRGRIGKLLQIFVASAAALGGGSFLVNNAAEESTWTSLKPQGEERLLEKIKITDRLEHFLDYYPGVLQKFDLSKEEGGAQIREMLMPSFNPDNVKEGSFEEFVINSVPGYKEYQRTWNAAYKTNQEELKKKQ